MGRPEARAVPEAITGARMKRTTTYHYHFCAFLRHESTGRERLLYRDGTVSLDRPAIGEGLAMLRGRIAQLAFDGRTEFVITSLTLIHIGREQVRKPDINSPAPNPRLNEYWGWAAKEVAAGREPSLTRWFSIVIFGSIAVFLAGIFGLPIFIKMLAFTFGL